MMIIHDPVENSFTCFAYCAFLCYHDLTPYGCCLMEVVKSVAIGSKDVK